MTNGASPNRLEPVEPAHTGSSPEGFKYSAFISYSHLDDKLVVPLHRYLEKYRTPRRLVNTQGRDGPVPKSLGRVFLDRMELPTSADLNEAVTAALKASRYLVVVCSPRSAKSKWVSAEVQTFKRLGRAKHILAYIIDGEPNATDQGQPADECFPPALRYSLANDGELSTTQRVDLGAADSRVGRDGVRRARLKLIAGLVGVDFPEFERRWFWQRLERAAIIATVTVAVLFVVSAAVIKWRHARADADAHQSAEQQALAQERQQRLRVAEETLQQGIELCKQGEVDRGLLRLAAALALAPVDADAASFRADIRASIANWSVQRHRLIGAISFPADAERTLLDPGGKLVVTVQPGGVVRLWDPVAGGDAITSVRHGAKINAVGFDSSHGRLLTAGDDGAVRFWDMTTGQPKGEPIRHGSRISAMSISPKAGRLATAANVPEGGSSSPLLIWDLATGKSVGSTKFDQARIFYSVALSPDGTRLAASGLNDLYLWDAETGKRLGGVPHDFATLRAEFSPDSGTVVSVASRWTRDGRIIEGVGDRQSPFGGMRVHNSDVELLDAATGALLTARRMESRYVSLCLATVGSSFFMIGQCDPTDASGVFTYYQVLDTNRQAGPAKVSSTGTLVPASEQIRFRSPVSAIGVESASTAAIGTWDGVVAVWNVGRSKRTSPPMRHIGRPQQISCSGFGNRVVVRATDSSPAGSETRESRTMSQEVRVWERNEIPLALGEDADRVRTTVEAATGLELLPSGEDRTLSPAEWRRRANAVSVPRP